MYINLLKVRKQQRQIRYQRHRRQPSLEEAFETAIFIGDIGLTMPSTGQLLWQHHLLPMIINHSIMTLIH